MVKPTKRKTILSVLFVLAVAFLGFRFTGSWQPKPEGVLLSVGGHLLRVRIADSPEELEKGLSGVAHLGENKGMLFVLPEGKQTAFHLKGTPIPLSIAFLDKNGVILKIEYMVPGEADNHPSPPGSRYALEVPGDWFDEQSVKDTDLVRPEFSSLSGTK